MIENLCPHPQGFRLETVRSIDNAIIRQDSVCDFCEERRPAVEAREVINARRKQGGKVSGE